MVVDRAGIGDEADEPFQGLVVDFMERLAAGDLVFDGRQLFAERLLLHGGDVVGDGSGHDLFGPLEAFAPDGVDSLLELGDLLVDVGGVMLEMVGEAGLDRVERGARHVLACPLRLDETLREVALSARGSAVLGGAVEVAVLAAASPLDDGVEHAVVADAAFHAADEVVLATVAAFAGGPVVDQHLLDALEDCLADDCFVIAVVFELVAGGPARPTVADGMAPEPSAAAPGR